MITVYGKQIDTFMDLPEMVLSAYEEKTGVILRKTDTRQRRKAVEELSSIGFFSLRDSVEAFSRRSDSSRITIYSDLARLKNK